MLPAWIYVLAVLVVEHRLQLQGLYKTPRVAGGDRRRASSTTRPMLALGGPLYGSSVGALTVYKVGAVAGASPRA